MSIKYIVRDAFKYNGKQYKPGEEFIPSGSKFDEQLIESKHVYIEDENVSTRRGRRLKSKERQDKIEKAEKRRAVYAMRSQKPPMTWENIAEMAGVSVNTAKKYYEQEKAKREKGKQDVKDDPRGSGKSNRRKASNSKG